MVLFTEQCSGRFLLPFCRQSFSGEHPSHATDNPFSKKFLLFTNPLNSSFENILPGYSGSNGTFKNENGNLKKDWFDYEWVSNDMSNTTTTGKPMFDYDTSVRVVMLSVLLGLPIMIMITSIIIIMIMIIVIIMLLLIGLAIVGNSLAFQTLATDGAGGLGRSSQ